MTQLGGYGYGNIYRVASDGTETVLYTFQGMPDGARPAGSLIMDSAGNLYGTTGFGGNSCYHSIFGCGVVFKLQPNGNETVLYAFAGPRKAAGETDGIVPDAGLVADAQGNLYGTTLFGGNPDCRFTCGTVFKVTPDGKETVLHTFSTRKSYEPGASLLLVKGYLYGTASSGSNCGKYSNHRCGSIFEVQK